VPLTNVEFTATNQDWIVAVAESDAKTVLVAQTSAVDWPAYTRLVLSERVLAAAFLKVCLSLSTILCFIRMMALTCTLTCAFCRSGAVA
jgi:hypothetical protein